MPQKINENISQILPILKEKLGSNMLSLLAQGEGMRGELSAYEERYDYIIHFRNITSNTINTLAEVKSLFPSVNFLFISDKEYKLYPKDSRLQFFITRRIYGNYDLGNPPSHKEVLDTAIKYAIELKDKIRPLLLASTTQKINSHQIEKSREILKMGDDCFMRVICLYLTGKYPLHRSHLREEANAESVNTILDVLDNWNLKELSYKDILESLQSLDRFINIFLTKVYHFKF